MKLDSKSGLLLPNGMARDDRPSELVLPASYWHEKEAKWIEEFTRLLTADKMKWRLVPEERGVAVRKHGSGQWLVVNVFETQMMPAATVFSMVAGWVRGKFTPDLLYRLLTPEEQRRLSNRVGEKPLASKQNSQNWLDRELKKREDLRRQGFDPQKEGLL